LQTRYRYLTQEVPQSIVPCLFSLHRIGEESNSYCFNCLITWFCCSSICVLFSFLNLETFKFKETVENWITISQRKTETYRNNLATIKKNVTLNTKCLIRAYCMINRLLFFYIVPAQFHVNGDYYYCPNCCFINRTFRYWSNSRNF